MTIASGTSSRAATPARERTASKALVEGTLALLAADDAARADREREIGEHVLDGYFGGDEAAARSKRPAKPRSYALLARRAAAETTWDEERLRRAVNAAIAWRSLSTKVRRGLSGRDLYRLASIDDVRVRRGLAAKLASGELAGRAADRAIAEAGTGERRGGRAPAPVAEKLADAVERALEGITVRLASKGLERAARSELAARLRASAERLAGIADRLG